LDLARTVAAHTDERRWAVLYRLFWRITHGGERTLLSVPTDADVRLAEQWRKSVSRDIHKLHAFVRFRLAGTDETTGREQFVAWFEPEYRILRLAAPFFEKRFAGMDWSILTPHECAQWDGERLHFTPGVPRSTAPNEDALEDLWRTYFKSIFNPARLKTKMMRQEMPRKYWKNLPEAALLPKLIAESGGRVRDMLATDGREVKPAPRNAYLESLGRKGKPES
jgi:DNA polymerase